MVSQYHFQRKRKLLADDFALTEFVRRFIAGETCAYGSWGDHAASWLATRHGQSGFLLLRYEDMVENTPRELAKIASFLGVAATPQLIAQAVERSSADQMRQLEKSQAQQFSSTKNTRQDIPFVRAAKAGGWRAALPEESAAADRRSVGPPDSSGWDTKQFQQKQQRGSRITPDEISSSISWWGLDRNDDNLGERS